MKQFLQRLIRFVAYTAAGVLIALAIAVGLFRLFLPRLPAYQAEIKDWASAAIGMQVEFTGMDARWGLSGPELRFYNTELTRPGSETSLVAANEVRVGVALTRLLADGTPVIDLVVIRDTRIDVREREDGRWEAQGSVIDELFKSPAGESRLPADLRLVGENLSLGVQRLGDAQARLFTVPRTVLSIDSKRIAFDAAVRLPADLGRQLRVSATQRLEVPVAEKGHWNVTVEADSVDLAGWTALQSIQDKRLQSGSGDLELAIDYAAGHIRNASARVEFADVALGDAPSFDVSGRFEFNATADGWLAAAEELQLATAENTWPEASVRVEASTDADDKIVMMDVRASYANLADMRLFAPWLAAEQQQELLDLKPDGVVRDLVATVSDIDTEQPRFDIAATLEGVGLAAKAERPGVRGFTGLLRANRLGGRLEIRSSDMTVELPEYLPEPVVVDAANGTVIWRHSDGRTTVLSDSIRISNEVFESQSNVQLTLASDGSKPVIDLASNWRINDISAVTSYLPQKVIKPKLYNWFQAALVKGSIPTGTTVLSGPLDKFPFDNNEGQFRVEASVRNLTFKYQPRWPAATEADMEVVLDGMRLYSDSNRFSNAGNLAVDAKVEIADLRDPVLTIDAFSTGTLQTIRQFCVDSPINEVFGGQLDRVTVAGEASFSLDLIVPLKDSAAFDFTSVIRSNNGTLAIEGFDPPISDLIGEVTIGRNAISSQSLGAQFLGAPIRIDLTRADEAPYSVIATARGSVAANGIINDLGVPLDGLISGATAYEARILFPGGNDEQPQPLTIQIASDLMGLALNLPEPVSKSAESTLQVSGDIRFMPGGEVIESAGSAETPLAWQLAFNKGDDAWDFDRGVVTLGRDVPQPADVRGLHIRGTTDTVRLEDWLNVSRSGNNNVGAADRIRSIELGIADLYAVGQHLKGHQLSVDRSARDWLVQIDGDDMVGSIFVPYEFDSERAMVIEMERMRLPGDDSSTGDPAKLDPRKLPPITVTAKDFALGDRYLGTLDARVERVAGGLEATSIITKDETFEVAATGRWLADDADELGSRTTISGSMTSRDVMRTMTRLGFAPGIVSDSMTAQFDVNWSGGPRAEFLDVLDGEVQVRFGNGQLEEVEPGAGRVFGLMSVVALPRRLSLDFRDVFNKGFGFDKIDGTFRIEDGQTYTCDLSLEGPAADIGIVGHADLVNRDYDQAAIVSANVGNTLPIVGAVVAGPQVAAALLIFSQIFKKPLQEVGQVYYSISGSWDEPTIDGADAAIFANRGAMAGCLANADDPQTQSN